MDDVYYSDIKARNILGYRVSDRSMEPEFAPGDGVVVNPNIPPVEGDFVLVKLKEKNTLLLRVLTRQGDGIKFIALNPSRDREHSVIDASEAHILGKVVEKKRNYG